MGGSLSTTLPSDATLADSPPLLAHEALSSAIANVARVVHEEQQLSKRGSSGGFQAPALTPEERAARDWLFEKPTFPPICVRPPWWLAVGSILITAGLSLSCYFGQTLGWDLSQHTQSPCHAAAAGEPNASLALATNGTVFCKDLLLYASIPIVSVVFTYGHIWLALWMTFFPTAFLGCWRVPGTNVGFPVGWQGIVPWKGRLMGQRACRLMTDPENGIITVGEILSRLEPEPFARSMGATLDQISVAALDAAAGEAAPRVWAALPEPRKAALYAHARAAIPAAVAGVLEDIRADAIAGTGFNLERVVDRAFVSNMRLVSAMFIRCGWNELVFIRNFGATMGGILGLVQMAIYAVCPSPWLLPAFGLVAGAATNWIALAMIFYPRRPVALCPAWLCCFFSRRRRRRRRGRRSAAAADVDDDLEEYKRRHSGGDGTGNGSGAAGASAGDGVTARPDGCCVMQGLFLRRQATVAAVYARVIATVLLTPRAILEDLCIDSDKLKSICRRRTLEVTEIDQMLTLASGGGGGGGASPSTTAAAAATTATSLSSSSAAAAPPSSAADGGGMVSGGGGGGGAAATGTCSAAAPSSPPPNRWLAAARKALQVAGSVGVGPLSPPMQRGSSSSSPMRLLHGSVADGGVWEAAREKAADVACAMMPQAITECGAYVSEAIRLEETIRVRMAALPPEQFESLLHSVFQEDEWKLVAVGGALGVALGAGQSWAFGALGLG